MVLEDVQVSDGGEYHIEITGSSGCIVDSNDITLSVNSSTQPSLSITSQPQNQEVCRGSQASFSVSVAGASPFSYQWRKYIGATPTPISNATSSNYIIPSVPNSGAGIYDVLVTNINGSINSSAAELIVDSPPEILSLSISPIVPPVGGNATISASASGSGHLTYQWFKLGITGPALLVNGERISGATTNMLNISSIAESDSGSYYVQVTGPCSPAAEHYFSLFVNTPPQITSQPPNQTVCVGSSAYFTVSASGISLSYQWRKNGINITGATESYYNKYPASQGDAGVYDVIISNSLGTMISHPATLKMISSPQIIAWPSDQALCSGGTARFSAKATGANLSYSWFKGDSSTPLANGTKISGADTGNLTISNADASDGGNYKLTIANPCESDTLYPIRLTVNSPPSITAQPSSQSACLSGRAQFNISATGTGTLTYQWQKKNQDGQFVNVDNAENHIIGATTASLVIDPVASGDVGSYRIAVTGDCGQTTSNSVNLTLNSPPSITASPQNQTVWTGGTATLSVTATGTGLTYHWFKGNSTDPLADGGRISGATTNTLTISSADSSDDADYYVVVSGTCSPAAPSTTAHLTVKDCTSFWRLSDYSINFDPYTDGVIPVDQVGNCSITMSPDNDGEEYIPGQGESLQWYKEGAALSNNGRMTGAQNVTLIINNPEPSDAGSYYLRSSGPCGTAYTSPGFLSIEPQFQISGPTPITYWALSGAQATFRVNVTPSGDYSYQWQNSSDYGYTWCDVPDGSEPTLALTASQESTTLYYRVKVTKSINEYAITKDFAELHIGPYDWPEDQSVTNNQTAHFECWKVGYDDGTGFHSTASYQWQVLPHGDDDVEENWEDVPDATSNTLEFVAIAMDDGNHYRAIIDDGQGGHWVSRKAWLSLTHNIVIEGLVLGHLANLISAISPAIAGQDAICSITVLNNRSIQEKGIEIKDTLPVSSNGSQLAGFDKSKNPGWMLSAGNASFGPFDLDAGATKSFQLQLQIPSSTADGTVLRNKVCISSKVPEICDEKEAAIRRSTDVDITSSQSSNLIAAGSQLIYSLKITNIGSSSGSEVNIVDSLPKDSDGNPDVAFISGKSSSAEACVYDLATHKVSCQFDSDLAPGSSRNITIVVSVPTSSADGSVLQNTACVYHKASDHDPDVSDCANNTAIVTRNLISQQSSSALKITKTTTTPSVMPGGTATFTISYSNIGNTDVDDVVIRESYPGGVKFISASKSPDAETEDTWSIGTLKAKESGSFTVSLQVPEVSEIKFNQESQVKGSGFANVYRDLSTAQESYTLTNSVSIASKQTSPVISSADVSVSRVPGTALQVRESGSGNYSTESTTRYLRNTNYKVIEETSSLTASQQPITLHLSDNRSLNLSTPWTEDIRSSSEVNSAKARESYRYASSLQRNSILKLEENGIKTDTAVQFQGQGSLEESREPPTAVNARTPTPFASSERYTGSFSILEKKDIYGQSAVTSRNSSGTGLVSTEKKLAGVQRTHESGTGSYNADEEISSPVNYIYKSFQMAYQPFNLNISSGFKASPRLKWEEGTWSKGSIATLSNTKVIAPVAICPPNSTGYATFLSQEFSSADRLNGTTEAKGLTEAKADVELSGKAEFRTTMQPKASTKSGQLLSGTASAAAPSGNSASDSNKIDIYEQYLGKYKISRATTLAGGWKYDAPHISVAKEGKIVASTILNANIARYKITVQNDGNRALGPVYIKDIFPSEVQFINSSIRPSDLTAQYANWTLIHLAVGGSITLELNLKLKNDVDRNLLNLVEVSGGYDNTWVEAGNFSLIEPAWLPCCHPMVSLTNTATLDSDDPSLVHCSLRMESLANCTMAIRVTDYFTDGLKLLNSSLIPQEHRADKAVWVIGDLEPGEVNTINYNAVALRSGSITNKAVLEAYSEDGSDQQETSATVLVQAPSGNAQADYPTTWQPPEWDFIYMDSSAGSSTSGDGLT